MKTITETILRKSIPHGQYLNTLPENALFFDIESTGLQKNSCSVYLIGTAVLTEETAELTFFFAETKEEEKDVICAFLQLLHEDTVLVTFNGDRFDIPFIKKRASLNGLSFHPKKYESCDLYRRARPCRKMLSLFSMSQKSLEQFLGIAREDEFDGGKLIPIYERYTKHPTEEDFQLLFQHNRDDVAGMLSVAAMSAYPALADASLTVESTELDEDELLLTAALDRSVPAPFRHRGDAAYLIIEENTLRLAVHRTDDGQIRVPCGSPKDYVYLPAEDTVVLKRLAATIPKDCKRPAKLSECYTKTDPRSLSPKGAKELAGLYLKQLCNL